MRLARTLLFTLLALSFLRAQSDWPSYGHDPGAARFSPLDQINTSNIARLQRATRGQVHGGVGNPSGGPPAPAF